MEKTDKLDHDAQHRAGLEQAFSALLDIALKSRDKCPWIKGQTIQSYRDELHSEAEELSEAIDNKDMKAVQEELGDVLWDSLIMMLIAERDNHMQARDVLVSVTEKICRRKPYLFEDRIATMEEASDQWHEAKAQEKAGKGQ